MEADRPDVQHDPIAYFRWFYAGDPVVRSEFEERWHPDVVLIQAPDMPGTAGEFHGWDGILALGVELQESFESVDWNPQQAIAAGDRRFLVILDPTARSQHGVEIKQADVGGWLGHVVTVHEDGRVVRLETFLDEEKAREAAGLTD